MNQVFRISWYVFLVGVIGSCGPEKSEEQTGSWVDQGDGTYRNPILNADYPDLDVDYFHYEYDGSKGAAD